ncbi:hypothetical protein SAMN04488036_1146 [Shimia haliotis]|uniref:Tetratricopeptide repeat-containing protein n=2 Tax=Shimia haliotis TaxID=1280847 RepID=A0A1I4HJD9_9RHOB|nr:hypothetical protein SAMN04488036_1146 [Shimia haliotis]
MSPSKKTELFQSLDEKSREMVEVALKCINESDGFVESLRLQEFLSYVVRETLAGRGAAIRGKSVAVDVYGRSLVGDAGQNLVRVEARRLRRLLTAYYEAEGKNDPVQIRMDAGGYRPRFVFLDTSSRADLDESAAQPIKRRMLPWAAGGAAAVICFGLAVAQFSEPPAKASPSLAEIKDPVRAALRQHSMLSLQAMNITEQAQGMLFPVFDLKRQELALGMFRHAIELDASLPGGHAGAAQTLTVLGLLSPDQTVGATYLENALNSAVYALQLAPADAWSNGAYAFVLAATGDREPAIQYATTAMQLSPKDGHVLDLVGMTAIVADDPELAALASDPSVPREGAGRFGSRNIWGVSQLMLGNYAEAIAAFEGAAPVGAPISPPSLLFQAVAFDQLAHSEKSTALLAELNATWPDFPTAYIVNALFADGSKTEQMILKTLDGNND